MSWRLPSWLLIAACLFVTAAASAAPAPLPKRERPEPLVAWVGNALGGHGCRLDEMRRDPETGGWMLRISRPAEAPGEKRESVALGPVSTERLQDVELLGLIAEV